jgi:UDP:flavonoid glycosyltransferase YjiC (YdhE family)
MADEALAPLLRPAGITVDSDRLHAGDLYLHPMPASMDQEAPPASTRRVRPPDVPPVGETFGEFEELGRFRPAVYATFGTEFGPVAPWGPLIGTLGEVDVDAVVTTGAAGLPSGLPVPANVRVREYVEQHELLGRITVAISHAGSGTLLGAAMRGVPQVCIPLGADQFENAGAAAARGIAVRVAPDERETAVIRDAITLGAHRPIDRRRSSRGTRRDRRGVRHERGGRLDRGPRRRRPPVTVSESRGWGRSPESSRVDSTARITRYADPRSPGR